LVFLFLSCLPSQPQDGALKVFQWDEDLSIKGAYTLGIVPQQTPKDIEINWGQLGLYLEQETGYTIHIKTASSIPEFEERCLEGRYDFAYMNPYHYVIYSEQPGYRAIARQKDKKIKGIIVMRKDREESSLSLLEKYELAFPSPAAFAASLLTRAHLQSMGVDFDPVYVRSHDSVYKAVAEGLYPAGGGVKRTFSTTEPEVNSQLEIIWTTKPYTPHAFAVHPRIDQDIVQKIQDALALLDNQEEFKDILYPIRFNGFTMAEHEDWDDVRALKLTELMLEPKMSKEE
jgi:phosphonate transport system substrate-binding protein